RRRPADLGQLRRGTRTLSLGLANVDKDPNGQQNDQTASQAMIHHCIGSLPGPVEKTGILPSPADWKSPYSRCDPCKPTSTIRRRVLKSSYPGEILTGSRLDGDRHFVVVEGNGLFIELRLRRQELALGHHPILVYLLED